MKALALVVLILAMTGCKSVTACDFDIHVRVTPNPDEECRALGVKWKDNGQSLKDTDRIRGCAPKGRIITDGTESNMGHEMKHQKDRNCK